MLMMTMMKHRTLFFIGLLLLFVGMSATISLDDDGAPPDKADTFGSCSATGGAGRLCAKIQDEEANQKLAVAGLNLVQL